MKIVHIKDLKWVKSPVDCEDFKEGEMIRVREVANYGKTTVTYAVFSDQNQPILVNGVHDHNCAYLDYRGQWMPVDEEGNGVILVID